MSNPNSNRDRLNLYIYQLHQRLRLGVSLRGVAILMATALITTIFLVLILNAFAFPVRGLTGARSLLLLILAVAAAFGLALPMRRLTRGRATAVAESAYPEFQQRLLTFDDREKRGNDPFLELLAADTLSVAKNVPPANLAPNNHLYFLAGAGFACLAVLAWLIAAGPGYLGYGASLLWTGPKAAPLYDIRVTPGDVAVRRNSDQLVTAQVIGLKPGKVQLFAHYQSARNKAWEPVAMQPQLDAAVGPGASNYQFLFAGLPEDVEYYVQADHLTSRHFKVRVVDLPAVKQMKVTYHYPKWTGMPEVTEEHGGDLRAIEGTNAELTVQMDHPLRNGQLTLDDGKQITLSGGEGNLYKGSILMQKDGAYHVAALDQGQPVRLSEDYFIATDKANPPQIAIDRPISDYRASPIEEVTVGVKATDDFGLNKMSLHYSVNGEPEKTIDLLQKPGAKNADGTATLSLEDFKLVPGDLVSLYATAKDGHAEARTDMSFIQADPFEREFSQSQQMGGGGGGGGGGGSQTDISKREKELIAATWKRQNEKTATPKDSAEAGNFLSGVQTKLQEQALALAARMDSRDLSSANEEFNSFGHDMQAAAAAMTPSSDKLKQMQWHDAIPAEQKALQYLLRAEATFRKIEVAFSQQRGGGGGGGGGGAGRDLASLFDLELDTEKNQYETAQTGSAAEQRAKAVDDALQKLDALAHRQEELAQQQRNRPQTMQERWQQEMLRREAEQLQKQMEQLAQNSQPKSDQQGQGGQQQQGQQGQQGQASEQGQQGQQSGGGSSSGSSSGGQSSQSRAGGSRAQSNADGGARDPRVTQALNRLREADQEMKRSAGQQQGAEAAKQAADQLRQAASLMSGTQQQQATGKLDSLSRETDRLSKEEHAQADRVRGLGGRPEASSQADYTARQQQRNKLAEDRQQLSDDLSQLEKNLRNAARELAPTQPQAASKLRDALGGMDQTDLTNRVQRTADWLRRGINPNSNGTEEGIGKGLDQLSQQVHQAQQGLGPGQPSQGQGEQTAALDHAERFRNEIESLTARGQNPLGRQPGQQQEQAGQQQGQGGQQQGQSGQPGQQSGQNGQFGQHQGSWSSRGGPGAQITQNGGGNQRGGNQVAQDNLSGDVGNWRSGGGAVGTAWNNINTGNNHFDRSGRAAPDNSPVPADPEATYRQGLEELSQLHHLAQNDPTALKEIQDLVREMQRLDPKRFPGNPAMVEQLHTEVLSGVDKLELQLRHDSDDQTPGQVRTTKEPPVPPGYEEAVAEYFRRLGKGQ